MMTECDVKSERGDAEGGLWDRYGVVGMIWGQTYAGAKEYWISFGVAGVRLALVEDMAHRRCHHYTLTMTQV